MSLTVITPFQLVKAETLSFEKGTVNESGTLEDNITYESFSATTYTDAGTIGSQNISYVKAGNDAPYETVAWSVLGNGSIVRADVLTIARDYEENHPGYEVIAAINGDYFDFTTNQTINAMVQEGTTVKYSNFYLERYFSVGFTGDESMYIANKNNHIESDFMLTIYDDFGMVIKEVYLDGTNKAPGNNQTTFYYGNLNEVNLEDTFMMESRVYSYTNYGSLMLKANLYESVDFISTNPGRVVIATKDAEVQEYLTKGNKIRIQKNMSDEYEGVENIMGVGSQPLLDGSIKEFEDINDQNVDFAKARHPRSAFGFSSEGDLYFVTFDGRQPGMDGVNLREMAYVLRDLGCDQGFNLDGGGSTQLAIRDGNNLRVLNSPSEFPNRRVANAILIVRPVAIVEDNFELIGVNGFDFDFTIENSNLIDNDILVYLNDELLEVTDNQISVRDLPSPGVYNLSIIAKEDNDTNDYTSILYNKRFILTEEIDDPVIKEIIIPSNYVVNMEKDDSNNGFVVNVQFDDPENRFVKMYIVYDETKILCSKASEGYEAIIANAEKDKIYSLKIEMNYLDDKFKTVSVLSSATYNYLYSIDDETPIIDDNDTDSNPIIYWLAGGSFIILSGAFLLLKLRKRPL
jgi:exopolysaccharide biosynthesis protein